MGSKVIQGQLWGQRSEDWAAIQERTGDPGYEFVIENLDPGAGDKLLDIGCGSGMFCDLVQRLGAVVTGIDASEPLLEQGKKRNPAIEFLPGEMEELPFADEQFSIVCGFNSFQYAANVKNALMEAKRVLQTGGKLAAMIWGNKEDCEAASNLKAIGSLLPPPPPGAPGPFALTDDHLLEKIVAEIGFELIGSTDVPCIWDYANVDDAVKGLLSSGPAARAINNSGFEKVYETVLDAVQPYIKANGHVVYNNRFRVVIAKKQKRLSS